MRNERSTAADMHDQYLADQAWAEQVKHAFADKPAVKESCCTGNCVQGRFCDCVPDVPAFADTPRASAAVALSLVLACAVLAMVLASESPRVMQWVAAL